MCCYEELLNRYSTAQNSQNYAFITRLCWQSDSRSIALKRNRSLCRHNLPLMAKSLGCLCFRVKESWNSKIFVFFFSCKMYYFLTFSVNEQSSILLLHFKVEAEWRWCIWKVNINTRLKCLKKKVDFQYLLHQIFLNESEKLLDFQQNLKRENWHVNKRTLAMKLFSTKALPWAN